MKLKDIIVMAAICCAVSISTGLSSSGVYAANGEKIFKKCKSCHNFKKNGVGPNLAGIVGREAGSLKFKYSRALKGMADEGLVWTEANLDKFLKKPRTFIKKTRMSFSGLKKDEDRKAVIEYLKGK